MRNFLLLLLFFVGISLSRSAAQNRELDSLRNILQTSKVDSVLFDANRLIAMALWENEPDSALYYSNISLSIATQLNDPSKKAMGFQAIGISYDYKDNLDSCLFYLNNALEVYRDNKLEEGASHILSDIAIAYYLRGNYELALRNYLASLEIREKYGNKSFIAKSYNNIGLVYRSRKDYANAAKYYLKSLNIKREINDEQGILNSLINIGSAFQNQGKPDSAFYYGNLALQQAKKINALQDIEASKGNMGAALVSMGRIDEALPLLQSVEKEAAEKNYKNILYSLYESLGDVYHAKKNYILAETYFKKGLDLALGTSRLEFQGVYYKKLALTAAASGNFKKAFDYGELTRKVNDSLYNAENSRQINELSAIYETAEKQKKIDKLNTDNSIAKTIAQRRKRERNYFILASVLFLGISVLAYAALVANKRKKEKLSEQNIIIEKALHEKEFLMKEIHHRVKNNLQVVSSLLKLQSHYIKDEQAQEAVRDSRNRVQSMALIHQNLYQEDNLTGIDVTDYIGKLCSNLFESYNIHPEKIKLIKEIQPLNLDVDTVVPLGLIINELVTNSLKYGFPGNRSGAVKIMLQEENSILVLKIFDNGVGLPNDFNEKYKSTFGFRMINAFIQKLKGELKTFNDEGTKVIIEMKNYKTPLI